eukprot:scaffold244985_cov18-Tisochrysis_lutea.AAC.1
MSVCNEQGCPEPCSRMRDGQKATACTPWGAGSLTELSAQLLSWFYRQRQHEACLFSTVQANMLASCMRMLALVHRGPAHWKEAARGEPDSLSAWLQQRQMLVAAAAA